MVIITDASGNIQAPTIPDNVYQGSNLANEIVFLAPLAQSNVVTITFRKPNGVLIEELIMREMTPYTSVPSEYNLSAWRYVLEDVITELYGQVTFQIKVRNGQGTVITSVGGTFPVLRGVPSIPSSDPSTSKWNAILDYVASIQFDIENGWLEARGLLPYHEDFEYSIGASVFDKATTSIYTSLSDNNRGNPLSDETKWGKTGIYNGTDQDIEQMIDDAITEHNNSATAHETLFNEKVNIEASSGNNASTIINRGNEVSITNVYAESPGLGNLEISGVNLRRKQAIIEVDDRPSGEKTTLKITPTSATINDKKIPEALDSYSNSQDDTYSANYINSNFVPLSFASRLYLSKTGTDTAELVNTAPTPSATNTLVVTSTNTSFDWNTPTLTITRTLETAIQLNNTNSFAVDLYFDLSRNTELTFGAKIKVSTDNGTTWTYISSNQSFGEKAYNNGFNSEDIVVYTDLATNETYPIGTLVAIELFKKQEHNSSLTTTYYCGVEIDGANVYSFVEFNFANTRINTNQIEDGAVTYDKLGQDVKDMIADPLPSHTAADTGKVLQVNNQNQVIWNYAPDEIVTFTKTNSSGTFAITSAEWVSAVNNDKAILRVTDGTDYYVLYKVKYDATTVYFEGSGKIAEFIKNGANYSGTFENLALTNSQIDDIMDAILD